MLLLLLNVTAQHLCMICKVLGSSQDMSEVLKNCQKLNPEMWECFGPSLRSEVLTLGKDQARRGGLFSAKAWCSVTKMIVILDTFRYDVLLCHRVTVCHLPACLCSVDIVMQAFHGCDDAAM